MRRFGRVTSALFLCTSAAHGAVQLGGASRSIKLNGPLAHGPEKSVSSFQVSPDQCFVVFNAYTAGGNPYSSSSRVFSARVDGRGLPVALVEPQGEDESWWFFGGFGARGRCLLLGRAAMNLGYDLFSVPIEGGESPIRLNGPLASGGSVWQASIGPDGERVVYLADQDLQDDPRLYATTIEGGDPLLLTGPGPVTSDFRITPDGERVVYQADPDGDGSMALHAVRIDGGSSPIQFGALRTWSFELDRFGDRVVFTSGPVLGPIELHSAPLDGSQDPVRLNADLVPSGNVLDFAISLDGQHVVYLADQEADGALKLYRVPIGGGQAPVELAGPFEQSEYGFTYVLHAGDRVVLLTEVGEIYEIHGVPLDGSEPARSLNGPLVPGGSVLPTPILVSPDGRRVVYAADQDSDDVLELYSVPSDGSSQPVKLNLPLPPDGDVFTNGNLEPGFALTTHGREVVYAAKLDIGVFPPPFLGVFVVPIDGSEPARALSVEPSHEFLPTDEHVLVVAGWWRELFSAPLDGSSPGVRVSPPLAAGPIRGDVRAFELGPSGERVAYAADQDTDEVVELYGVSTSGKGPGRVPLKLNAPAERVQSFRFSPDGERIVYVALRDAPELFSVPSAGGAAPVRLSAPLVAGGEVVEGSFTEPGFEISPGGRVVYLADQETDGVFELYSSPIDGSAGPVKLNGVLVPQGDVSRFQIAVDGGRVVYRADQDQDQQHELFSAPIDGTQPAIELTPLTLPVSQVQPDFRISAEGAWVLYRANAQVTRRIELFAVPIDGSAPPHRLNQPFIGRKNVLEFQVSNDALVVFLADPESLGHFQLYGVPADGSASPVRLHPPLAPGRDVLQGFRIDPRGERVVFLADAESEGVNELFSASIEGSRAPVRLNAPLGTVTVSSFRITPDGERVLFRVGGHLYGTPIRGGAVARISVAPVNGGVLEKLEVAPDSSAVVFAAFGPGPTRELYRAPIDGVEKPVQISQALATSPLDFRFSSDGRGVVHFAQRDEPGVTELFFSLLAPAAGDLLFSGEPARR